jgi:hypothetical protein
MRRQFSMVTSMQELRELSQRLDRTMSIVDGGERLTRGHTNGPIKVVLPEGFLENRDDMAPPADAAVTTLSGG